MPKPKNAPLLKAAPADLIKARQYFRDGAIDPDAFAVVRELRDAGSDLRQEMQSRLVTAIQKGNAPFLRAVADAIDAEREQRGVPADPLPYWLCVCYMMFYSDLAYKAGVPVVHFTGWQTAKIKGRQVKIATYSGVPAPCDPGPGLRPAFRTVLARMRKIPALESFFDSKLNPERQIRAVAKTLGMKFGGKVGRPRKP